MDCRKKIDATGQSYKMQLSLSSVLQSRLDFNRLRERKKSAPADSTKISGSGRLRKNSATAVCHDPRCTEVRQPIETELSLLLHGTTVREGWRGWGGGVVRDSHHQREGASMAQREHMKRKAGCCRYGQRAGKNRANMKRNENIMHISIKRCSQKDPLQIMQFPIQFTFVPEQQIF